MKLYAILSLRLKIFKIERFTRALFMLILFYKTRLSRLNLSISLALLITSSSSLSNLQILSFFFKSLKNFSDNIDKFIEIFFNKVFVNKSKKKKEEKEKEKENKKIINEKKKENNNNKIFRD